MLFSVASFQVVQILVTTMVTDGTYVEGQKKQIGTLHCYMGVSENSVPLNPMVLLIIIPELNGYFIGNIPYFQTNPHCW